MVTRTTNRKIFGEVKTRLRRDTQYEETMTEEDGEITVVMKAQTWH